MWPSSVKEKLGSSRRSSSLTSSSSTSSSSSSTVPHLPPPSPLPFSLQQQQQQQQQQIVVPNPTASSSSLEDVWKDIRLSSLDVNVNVNHSSSSSKSKDINLNPVIFQDFFGKESLMKVVGSSSSTGRCVPPAPPSPADTFLSLTPVALPGFNILFKEKQQQHQPPLLKSPSRSDSGFCSSSVGSRGVKRDIDPSSDSPGGGDHRHKRMIKNRESACRSRARKQAYTNELELAVSNLKKENAGLKEQLNQFHIAAAAQQYSRKQPLKRMSTAPF